MSNQPNNRNRLTMLVDVLKMLGSVILAIAAAAPIISALNDGFDLFEKVGIIPLNKQSDRSESPQSRESPQSEPVHPSPAARPEQAASSRMDGVWVLTMMKSGLSYPDSYDDSNCVDFVMILKSAGNAITGELIGKMYCKSRIEIIILDPGKINGTVNRSKVDFTWESNHAYCRDEKMKFTGTISEDGNFFKGTYKPVGRLSTMYCRGLWEGDFEGKKRSYN